MISLYVEFKGVEVTKGNKPKGDCWRLVFMNWIFRSGIWLLRCGMFYDLPILRLALGKCMNMSCSLSYFGSKIWQDRFPISKHILTQQQFVDTHIYIICVIIRPRVLQQGSSNPASWLLHLVLLRMMQLQKPSYWKLIHATQTHTRTPKKNTTSPRIYCEWTQSGIRWYPETTLMTLFIAMMQPSQLLQEFINLSINRDDRCKCPDPWRLGHVRQVHLNNAFQGIKTGFDMHLFLLCRMIQLGCERRTVNSPGHEIRCPYSRYRFMTLPATGPDGSGENSWDHSRQAMWDSPQWLLLRLFLAAIY